MVLEGQARYFIDDKYYTLQRGEIAIINQGVTHGESPMSGTGNSSNHFITFFRKYIGCTPKQYHVNFQEMTMNDRF